MAITYFGSASTPADNGASNTSPTAVTPPASMVTGDLVIMTGLYRGSSAVDMSEAGGQTWSALQSAASATLSQAAFWARYDGTWDANPSMSSSATTNGFTVVMHVFRPSAGENTWDVDVSVTEGTFSAPSTPFDVTITGITTLTNGSVVLATYCSSDDCSWTVQTAGWAHAGTNQYRNTAGADSASSYVYQVFPSAGGTGDVLNRQSVVTGIAGRYAIVAFKETGVAITTEYVGPTAELAQSGGMIGRQYI